MSTGNPSPYFWRDLFDLVRKQFGGRPADEFLRQYGIANEAELVRRVEEEAERFKLQSARDLEKLRAELLATQARVEEAERRARGDEETRRSLITRIRDLARTIKELAERIHQSPTLVEDARNSLIRALGAPHLDVAAASVRESSLVFLSHEPIYMEAARAAVEGMKKEMAELETQLAGIK